MNTTEHYQLTNSQVADFLFRHPVVATQVAETKSAIFAGLYDWDYNPYEQWRLPGIIPPWGMQVEDSNYGMVTIFPARDGTIYYSANSPDLNTDDPDYVSPIGPCPSGTSEMLGLCVPTATSLVTAVLVVGAIYLLVKSRKG